MTGDNFPAAQFYSGRSRILAERQTAPSCSGMYGDEGPFGALKGKLPGDRYLIIIDTEGLGPSASVRGT